MTAPLTENARNLRVRCLAGFLFQACLLVYVLLGWLAAGPWTEATLGAAATLNLAAYLVARRPVAALVPVATRLAPIWGLATWAVLTYLGGGVGSSLFLVGFWFEIILAGVGMSVSGVALTTLASAICLCALQAPLGYAGVVDTLALQTSFLAIVGAATAWIRRGSERRQQSFTLRLDEEQRRLESIEEKLADAQTLADLGAQTARLGHGLKNAVHSLRGFSTLIERGHAGAAKDSAALRGLKDSIDQLEHMALASLEPQAPAVSGGRSNGRTETSALREVTDATTAEVALCFPNVEFSVAWQASAELAVPTGVLTEVLSNLLKNAAEAMDRGGHVTVQVTSGKGSAEIKVIDDGPGIPADMRDRIFRPGHSTKSSGHGMGLYIAHRLMESHGGALSLAKTDTGTTFLITLPASWKA